MALVETSVFIGTYKYLHTYTHTHTHAHELVCDTNTHIQLIHIYTRAQTLDGVGRKHFVPHAHNHM